MKIGILPVLMLLFFSCGQKTAQKPIHDIPKQITEITFAEEIIDFGNLKAGEIVIQQFEFVNAGQANLYIENITSDCGCISVKFNKTPVKPNDKGAFEIEFNSSGLFGKQYKSIELTANCKEPKHLTIFANVLNENLEIKY
jgi:hypothetical protein